MVLAILPSPNVYTHSVAFGHSLRFNDAICIYLLGTDNLLIDYQFTFSLVQDDDRHYTAINFMASPEQVTETWPMNWSSFLGGGGVGAEERAFLSCVFCVVWTVMRFIFYKCIFMFWFCSPTRTWTCQSMPPTTSTSTSPGRWDLQVTSHCILIITLN